MIHVQIIIGNVNVWEAHVYIPPKFEVVLGLLRSSDPFAG